MTFTTKKGTGTGEIDVVILTVDGIPVGEGGGGEGGGGGQSDTRMYYGRTTVHCATTFIINCITSSVALH